MQQLTAAMKPPPSSGSRRGACSLRPIGRAVGVILVLATQRLTHQAITAGKQPWSLTKTGPPDWILVK